MAEKSVITNIEARIRQLIDDHKRLSESCAELTAQRDNLKAENRTLQERIRELDGELSRMQLTECKTLIHQFKSGRHLQKIPGC